MSNTSIEESADYIIPVNMNKLQGRMLRYTKTDQPNKEILLVYGHHTSIERCWELIRLLGNYGIVTVPDFPGFGGMENLYKIYEDPDIDNLADYLAAFFKLRYKRRRVTLISIGYGFLITTRMLQKYPDIAQRIDLCVGINAFSHYEDIMINRSRRNWYRFSAYLLKNRAVSLLFRFLWLKIFLSRYDDNKILKSTHKFNFRGDSFFEPAKVDYKLWSVNDFRTHAQAIRTMLAIDNCQYRVNLPLWHISFGNQTFFNAAFVEQHLKVIYAEYHKSVSRFNLKTPLGSPDNKVDKIITPKLRQKLLETIAI
jgi:pimeloyl-ACP methyl ester carboxylesterase